MDTRRSPDVPFADMLFNAIAVDPRDPKFVYAGSDNGLWTFPLGRGDST
jgi:hypothetical protein